MKFFKHIILILISGFFLLSFNLEAKNRFPKPEFENGHVQPDTLLPFARADILAYLDIFLLILSMSVITWFILKKRSQKGVFWTMVFALLYFGFYREGCVCSIGSIQNVTLALFDSSYRIGLSAVLFFIIPILYTLFFGRTFCAGICPLGALQDIVALKPMNIKSWLEKVLGVIPFIYLGLAVLYAATGTDFIICRYDPYVGFFRLEATFGMFVVGGLFLLLGVFIARPYCRFLCPYGAILNVVSRFSKHHMTITPAECIQCHLCEHACPVGAIDKPTPLREKESPEVIKRRFVGLAIIIPLLIFTGGYIASNFHMNLAQVNSKVKLAQEMYEDSNYGVEGQEALEITAFKTAGQTLESLYEEANAIIDQFYLGSWILGCFIGLVFGLTLINLTVFRYRVDYTPNKATCHSCAKCMDYCPIKIEDNDRQ